RVLDCCIEEVCFLCVFFFSSRRRHTRLQGDWSSDVCSSDLDVIGKYVLGDLLGAGATGNVYAAWEPELDRRVALKVLHDDARDRSEERRVGKECRTRWSR